MMNASDRLLTALRAGEELSPRQIQSRFRVANPRDLVYRLRREGHVIYLSRKVNSRGKIQTKYYLGKPSQKLVAAAVRMFGANYLGLTRTG
jgi:hypothetical protein